MTCYFNSLSFRTWEINRYMQKDTSWRRLPIQAERSHVMSLCCRPSIHQETLTIGKRVTASTTLGKVKSIATILFFALASFSHTLASSRVLWPLSGTTARPNLPLAQPCLGGAGRGPAWLRLVVAAIGWLLTIKGGHRLAVTAGGCRGRLGVQDPSCETNSFSSIILKTVGKANKYAHNFFQQIEKLIGLLEMLLKSFINPLSKQLFEESLE